MVGSQVLEVLLTHDQIEEVVSLGRRKTGLADRKLKEIVHSNFLDFSSVGEHLAGLDLCIYCLATYQQQVSKEQYVEITCDFQKALTDTLVHSSPDLTFVLFGASGADPTEKSSLSFARIKGKAERLLMQTRFPRKYIFRPGYIHPVGEVKPSGFFPAMSRWVGGGLLNLFPGVGLTNRQLAEAMVQVGLSYPPEANKVFENADIRRLME